MAGMLACAGAPAQGLEDPTRPPAGMPRQAKPPAADLVLQSVIISEAGRAALISGELVPLGGRVGNARLVRVGEAEVDLLVGDERRTLALFPGVDKRGVAPTQDGQGNDGGER
jgi:hypothetical protein